MDYYKQQGGQKQSINSRSLDLAVLGDSLSTGFHVSSILPMIYRARTKFDSNWFIDTGGSIQSVAERCSYLGRTSAYSFARASAHVDESSKNDFVDLIMGARNLEAQAESLVRLDRFPDIVLLWIGHNNLDWAKLPEAARTGKLSSVKKILVDRFVKAYRHQLEIIIDAASQCSHPTAVLVFGLVDFELFFRARQEVELLKARDNSLYPYLEQDYTYFLSLKPQYRDGMIELAQSYNSVTKALVEELSSHSIGESTLNYSNAMTRVDISSPESLSTCDGWHPSAHGHRLFAAGAYEAIAPLVQSHFKRESA